MSVAKRMMFQEMRKDELRSIAEDRYVEADAEELDTIVAAMLEYENAAQDLAAVRSNAKLKMLEVPKNASKDWITGVFSKVGNNLPLKGIEKYQTAFFKAEVELHRLKELYKEKE